MASSDQLAKLADEKLSMGFMVRREMKKLPQLLGEGEEVVNLARGEYGGKEGLIAATDRRIIFVEEGMVRHRLEDFPYNKVSSILTEAGIRSGKLTIFASGNKAEITDVHPKQRASEIGDYVRGRIGTAFAGQAAPSPPVVAPDGPMEQLRKLGELRDAGLVTPEEFEAKKADILARM